MLAVKILMLVASSQSMAEARAAEYCDGLPHAFYIKYEKGEGDYQPTTFVCQKTFPKHLTRQEVNDVTFIPVEAEK